MVMGDRSDGQNSVALELVLEVLDAAIGVAVAAGVSLVTTRTSLCGSVMLKTKWMITSVETSQININSLLGT